MSFDAITGIAQAEEAAKVAVQYAKAQARQMVLDAEAAGKADIEAAIAKAEKELAALNQKSDAKSVNDAKQMLKSLEEQKSALRAAAERKMNSAAALVVERIVKS